MVLMKEDVVERMMTILMYCMVVMEECFASFKYGLHGYNYVLKGYPSVT